MTGRMEKLATCMACRLEQMVSGWTRGMEEWFSDRGRVRFPDRTLGGVDGC